jgi:hypothetical protein
VAWAAVGPRIVVSFSNAIGEGRLVASLTFDIPFHDGALLSYFQLSAAEPSRLYAGRRSFAGSSRIPATFWKTFPTESPSPLWWPRFQFGFGFWISRSPIQCESWLHKSRSVFKRDSRHGADQKLLIENFTVRGQASSDSAVIARRLRKDRIISTVSFHFY